MSYPYAQILKEIIIFCEKTQGLSNLWLFLYVALAGLELTMKIRLALNSQRSSCLSPECWD